MRMRQPVMIEFWLSFSFISFLIISLFKLMCVYIFDHFTFKILGQVLLLWFIGLLRKLHNTLPRQALITIYKAFVRPLLDYGDTLYDQAYNASFHQKLEKIQYNACIAITGAICGTSKEKIYQELGLEALKSRRWFRKRCFFFLNFEK